MTREESIDTLEWGVPYLPTDQDAKYYETQIKEFMEALKVAVADMRKVEEVGKAIKELKIVLESYEAVEHTQSDYRQGMIDGMTRCIKPIEELITKGRKMTDFEIPIRGKWKKTTIRHMTGEVDAYRCSLCGGTCQWKHKICPICKGSMNVDEESEDKNEQ